MAKKARTPGTGAAKADTCKQVTSLVLDYVRGLLERATASALEAHLSICPDCVAFLETYRKTIQATQSLKYEEIPPQMVERIEQFLSNRRRASGSRS